MDARIPTGDELLNFYLSQLSDFRLDSLLVVLRTLYKQQEEPFPCVQETTLHTKT